jgi:Zn-dependent protease
MSMIFFQIAALLFAVTIHEAAHGWVAWRCGDPTAKMLGRVSLNPIVHIDPVGSVIFPGVLALVGSPFIFGWAKPVPVNPRYFRNFKRDNILVSAAGVSANLACALAAGLVFQLVAATEPAWAGSIFHGPMQGLAMLCQSLVVINCVLAVFNLIPIPPLDGGGIVSMILPPQLAMSYEKLAPYGMILLIVLLATGVVGQLFRWVVIPLARMLLGL